MFFCLYFKQVFFGSKKIVGVFYKVNEYVLMNFNFVGCVEGVFGIREWLELQGYQYIVTDDKDGLYFGQCIDLCVLLLLNDSLNLRYRFRVFL